MDWEKDSFEAAEISSATSQAALNEQATELHKSMADVINAAV